LKLSGECARTATEFGIVFVITVVALDDEGAVGEVLVIRAVRWYVEACNWVFHEQLNSNINYKSSTNLQH
jgi:hypothetical protein